MAEFPENLYFCPDKVTVMQTKPHFKFYVTVLALLLATVSMSAQDAKFGYGRLEISFGWGDQMFETAVWHKVPQVYGLLPESEIVNSNEEYKYSQHWFLEAGYNINGWLKIGGMADVSGVYWKNVTHNGKGDFLQENGKCHFTNVSVMPTFRFTYLRKPHVMLHSGVGFGFNINTGTETDFRGKKTEVAPAGYLNFVGVTGQYNRFFATLDLGMLVSVRSISEVYLAGSRLVSVGVGIIL